MRRLIGPAAIVLLGLLVAACAGYTSALGFRSRRAVLENDASRFEDLMDEAVDATPAGPLDNPELTVLTHFLDLAGDPLFFPFIEKWMQNGWVSDTMTCAIHRARFRATRNVDPVDADRSAQVCIRRARVAAHDPELAWEVDRCLEEAPFLVDTSTTALIPYLKMVADPTEPLKFRVGLLDGMTRVYISSPSRLLMNDSSLTREEASKMARAHVDKQRERLDFIIEASRAYVSPTVLGSATARGVLEVENVSVALAKSFIGRYAASGDPYLRDLAWTWVRTQKNKKKVRRIAGLGIYNRAQETKKDVFWYLCSKPAGREDAESRSAVLGPLNVVEAISIREKAPVEDLDALRTKFCVEKSNPEPYPYIGGPYPLESTGRGTLSASVAASLGEQDVRTSVLLRRRVLH